MEHNPPTMGDYAYADVQRLRQQQQYDAVKKRRLRKRVRKLERRVAALEARMEER